MAESNYSEPDFSDAQFSSEERRRMRRMLWYNDRSDFMWSTLRRWALIWTAISITVALFRDQIKWLMKVIFS